MNWISPNEFLPNHTKEVIIKCKGYPPRVGCCIYNPACRCEIQNNPCCRVWVINDSKYRAILLNAEVSQWAEIPEFNT